MTHTRDIGSNFHTIGETNSGNLTNSRVRLLGGFGGYFSGYTTLEGRVIENRSVLESIETARKSHRFYLAGNLLSLLSN